MIDDAVPNSMSPTRIAVELPYFALALGAPRRTSASSITSSWHSDATWVSSTPAAAATTSALMPVPSSEASRVSSGRNRLPPASMRWVLASAMNASSWSTSRRSSASTSAEPVLQALGQLVRRCRAGRGPVGSVLTWQCWRHRRHRRNCDDRSARSRACDGRTPSTSVTSVPMVIATVVNGDAVSATTTSPAGGSVKYISTISRT